MNKSILFLISYIIFFCAISLQASDIPSNLNEWKSWVLHGKERQLCPTNYNDGFQHKCAWPSRLTLFIEEKGGRFEQQWLIFADTWAPLPGNLGRWPNKVILNGKKVPVMSRNNVPSVHISTGKHTVKGSFKWNEMPEIIQIPASTGLINLFIKNAVVKSPILDKGGRLWLQKRAQSKGVEDRFDMHIFRLLNDSIPMKVVNHLKINIAGRVREINLDEIFIENSIPMSIKSPLPARIGTNGKLTLQARPGNWEIEIVTRFKDPVYKIGPVNGKYGREIWLFKSQNHLRMVKIEGAPAIEPSQTDAPHKWRNFPAYIINKNSEIVFKQIRRGDPEPSPDRLNIHRIWWLDFDGKGFTAHDQITGIMNQKWRLSMNPPGELGRVSVDGIDQLITTYNDKKSGVELRRGQLNLEADSRFTKSVNCIPAVGWNNDFQSVSATLNLPHGWRLLFAKGVDSLHGTCFQRWTLLDFFLVLIIGLATLKLKNPAWGILALLTMTLIYHESGAPRLVWLHILASLALIRALPDGSFKKLSFIWNIGSIIVLIAIVIPFMVHQIRYAIYPQLEPSKVSAQSHSPRTRQSFVKPLGKMMERKLKSEAPLLEMYSDSSSQASNLRIKETLSQDPNALIQTGPGLPSWKWRSFNMQWNGPVDKNQQIQLWLIPPFVNLALAFVRVGLVMILIFGLTDHRLWINALKNKFNIATFAVFILISCISVNAQADNYPPETLLRQLQDRLLEKPDCLPYCADCISMKLKVDSENLSIFLKIHGAVKTAIPLPTASSAWFPREILLDKRPANGLLKTSDGQLWALIPKGIHTILMTGKTNSENSIQISLPFKPHNIAVESNGWNIQGLRNDGRVDSIIQLTRLKKEKQKSEIKSDIPPFLHIKRVLRLGLTWQISTFVKRITPVGVPVIASMPLMEGESVTTTGVHVKDKCAQISMDSKAKEMRFTSILKMSNEIKMSAPKSVLWTETWILDASPIWHCEISGIPVIHCQNQQGRWNPEWKPWHGENITIKVSRPKAVAGKIVTIDNAVLKWVPGIRFSKAELDIKMRASRGVQHQITLPQNADLQLVKINNKSQPIKQEKQKLIIPLQPGTQQIHIQWRQPTKSFTIEKAPEVNIGSEAVNVDVIFNMPKSRWILWASAPRLGPAVLFWNYLFVVVIVAFGLGRIKLTPLKTIHWILLGVGFTQIPPLIAMSVAGWLICLGLRKKYVPPNKFIYFNGIQIALVLWTFVALSGLYQAIENGLLGMPDMRIVGNNSSNFCLRWTQDRIDSVMPMPWVISLPLTAYHVLMLAWALWLAFFLLKWFKWAWKCLNEGGLWKSRTPTDVTHKV